MGITEVIKGRYYPEMPPALPGETDEQYTDRLTGADGTDRRPYDHSRNRQCSIGYHYECSRWRAGNVGECECPCHEGPFKSAVDLDIEDIEGEPPAKALASLLTYLDEQTEDLGKVGPVIVKYARYALAAEVAAKVKDLPQEMGLVSGVAYVPLDDVLTTLREAVVLEPVARCEETKRAAPDHW